MTQLTIFTLSILTTILFTQMYHPLAMGLSLLVQTVLICLISGMMSKTFWFSYTLFLIFLGGMLVLFIYVASLASNEMFSPSSSWILISITSLSSMMLLSTKIDKTLVFPPVTNTEMLMLNSTKILSPEDTLTLIKIYNFPTNMITLMAIMYLLMALVAIVKITNTYYGPLRLMT